MMPDSGKPLGENLAVLGDTLRAWAAYCVDAVARLPEEEKLFRATLRAISGGLHYSANEARRLASTKGDA